MARRGANGRRRGRPGLTTFRRFPPISGPRPPCRPRMRIHLTALHPVTFPENTHEDESRDRLEGGRTADDRRGRSRRTARRRGPDRSEGHRHLPHRLLHPLGRRPRGHLPGDPRARGRGRRRRRRAGRRHAEEGRSRDSALHARMPRVQVLPVAQDEPVPEDPRDPRPRPDARRDVALLGRRQADLPLHGHVHVLELHRGAGDRGREGARGRAVRQDLLHRLRRDDGRRRGRLLGEGRGGRERRRVRPRRHRPECDPGREDGGRGQDHRRRSQPEARRAREEVRHDALHQPERSRERRRPHRAVDGRRRRLFVRMHRQREGDAPGARVHAQGVGAVVHHRRRGGRRGNQHAAVPARDRPRVEGLRVRRRARAHRRAEDRRLVHGRQDQHRRPDHAHAAAREDQRRLRADEEGRIDPLGRAVLIGSLAWKRRRSNAFLRMRATAASSASIGMNRKRSDCR
ncbi:hypothetical protein BURPS1710b_1024 [Burkholderia pseudomallei 1710b]|uniref:Uncharacterized protein n=1 Tax=Burkholderia pseudomallei (strain 1710b) TaxID=320372 RepID=Q3JVG7_BURP1|nr:hypothetical protein BURPS1710b_1024 [Burkholderia pseudomallei 1710b]